MYLRRVKLYFFYIKTRAEIYFTHSRRGIFHSIFLLRLSSANIQLLYKVFSVLSQEIECTMAFLTKGLPGPLKNCINLSTVETHRKNLPPRSKQIVHPALTITIYMFKYNTPIHTQLLLQEELAVSSFEFHDYSWFR